MSRSIGWHAPSCRRACCREPDPAKRCVKGYERHRYASAGRLPVVQGGRACIRCGKVRSR